MMPPEKIPTARELAAQANGNDPWACRMCGCRDWRVKDSRLPGIGPRKRERVCRNCGEPMTTQEMPVPEGHKLVIMPEAEEEAEYAV